MDAQTEIIRAELPEVAAIIRDECWLEGERRGQAVDPSDAAIQQRVADIILRGAGLEIRSHYGACEDMGICATGLPGTDDSRAAQATHPPSS